jgi:hypothetical protein
MQKLCKKWPCFSKSSNRLGSSLARGLKNNSELTKMALNEFAQERLKLELVGYRKNGLQFWLKHLASVMDGIEEMEHEDQGFIPAGTRLRRQPACNPECEPWDITLELWDIDGAAPKSDKRLRTIQMFANDLFDLSFVFTEWWVCDSYGTNRRKVYDVRDDITGPPMPDAQPHEWFCDGVWKQGNSSL